MTAADVVLVFDTVVAVADLALLVLVLQVLRRPRPSSAPPGRTEHEEDTVALDHQVDRLNRVTAAAERALRDQVGRPAP